MAAATRIILGAEPGVLFDRAGRAISESFAAALGGPVRFDNVGDSSGVEGAAALAGAPRDGATLAVCNKGALTSHPHVETSGYRPDDFVPLARFAEAPIAVAVAPQSPFRSLADLVEAARRRPGTIGYSTPNPFHTQRLAMTDFCARERLELKFVVLPGGNRAAIERVIDGTVDFAFLAAHNYVAPRQAGALRILGVAAQHRLRFLPDDPTFLEQGYDLATAIWLGLFAPHGVPEARLAQLRRAAEAAFTDARLGTAIDGLHMVPAFLDHGAFAAAIAADHAFHRGVLRALGALK